MSRMKFSAPDWCYINKSGLEPKAYYARLLELGIEAVECVPPERWATARKAGMTILDISGPGMGRGLNRLENHASLVPEIADLIEEAAKNEIKAVIVFSGNREGQPDAEGIDNCVKALKQLAPRAEAAGVGLLFEMLNSYNHADYQADHGFYGFEVVSRVDSPALRVLYDIYHLARMGDDIPGDLLKNLHLVGHIHLAETPDRTKPLANGNVAHAEIIPRVLAAGYQGLWGLEFIPGGDPFVELEESMRELS